MQTVADGASRKTVAAALGVDYKTVACWDRAAREPGGLAPAPRTAHPPAGPTLTCGGWRACWRRGKAPGWHNDLWTAARVDQPEAGVAGEGAG